MVCGVVAAALTGRQPLAGAWPPCDQHHHWKSEPHHLHPAALAQLVSMHKCHVPPQWQLLVCAFAMYQWRTFATRHRNDFLQRPGKSCSEWRRPGGCGVDTGRVRKVACAQDRYHTEAYHIILMSLLQIAEHLHVLHRKWGPTKTGIWHHLSRTAPAMRYGCRADTAP